jgi:DNA-binding transcriptional MocR family regulator
MQHATTSPRKSSLDQVLSVISSGDVLSFALGLPATDADDLCAQAVEKERIAFLPGSLFAAGPSRAASSCLRLSYSNSTPAMIDEGVSRLGLLIKTLANRSGGME